MKLQRLNTKRLWWTVQIVEMIEYQDASAFISRANAVFVTIHSDIDAQKAEEILEIFEQLESSLQANADPER